MVSMGIASSSGLNQDVACCHWAMQRLHLLATGVDAVVALVFVVLERHVEVDLVGELSEVVVQEKGREQPFSAVAERALEVGVLVDPAVELAPSRVPRGPVGVDILEIPLLGVVNEGAVAGADGGHEVMILA